jgi:putative heme-binding domain-containing protein
LSEELRLSDGVAAMAADPDPQVQFQAALTIGGLGADRALPVLAELAHRHSADPWFRLAILSSVADSASRFFHLVLAKGEPWTDPQMLVETSALIGSRQNPAELAAWFGALRKVSQPEKYLAGLTRGLRLVGARNLRVPGVEQSLAPMLGSPAAWEASRHFELAGLIRRAQQDALDAALPVANRVSAIAALRGGRFEPVAPVLEGILRSHAPPEVEAAAVDSLASFDETAAGTAILANWRGYGPAGRTRAIGALLGQRNRIPLLLAAIEKGEVERAALDAAARSHLYEDADRAIAAKARALLESGGTDRAKVVAEYQDAARLSGDVTRGRKLFEENCSRCHESRRGGRIGPDLSGINNKTRPELITSILNPSSAIDPRFVNYIVTTKDGRMHDGIIAGETPSIVTLRGGPDGGDETILRMNIAEMRASSVSLMPDELEKSLGKQGLADVIAYLRGGL